MKVCKECKVSKSLIEYYTHPMMNDGHLSFCKECVKRRVRIFSKTRAGKIIAKRRQKTDKRKQWLIIYQRKRRKIYKDKYKARTAVGNALRDKRLQRRNCEVCGAVKSEGHHPNYSKPLEVIWLCREHHRAIHKIKSK